MFSITISDETYEGLRAKFEQMATVLARFATVDEARMTPTAEALVRARQPRPLSPTAVAPVDSFEAKDPAPGEPVVVPKVEQIVDTINKAQAAVEKDDKTTGKKAPKAAKPPSSPRALVDELDLKDATLATLKEAFAGGKRDAVMALLGKFGNGAKTFRELPDDAFPAIRKEIEAGALA